MRSALSEWSNCDRNNPVGLFGGSGDMHGYARSPHVHTRQLMASLLQLPTTFGRNNLLIHPILSVHSVETLSVTPQFLKVGCV